MKFPAVITIILLSILSASCKRGFEPIQYGKEACANCKMTIVDHHFAAEMITKKGKVYKFDDVACMRHFVIEQNVQDDGLMLFVADYNSNDPHFIDARNAVFLHNEYFRSPMNGGYGAFTSSNDASKLALELNTTAISWADLK